MSSAVYALKTQSKLILFMKWLRFSAIITLCLFVYSCSTIESAFEPSGSAGASRAPSTLLPYVQNNKVGFLDEELQSWIAPTYGFNPNDPDWPYSFTEGLAAVTINGQTVYINRAGDIAIQSNFQEGYRFSEGLALVKTQGQYGYITPSGHFRIEARFNDAKNFNNGLAAVQPKAGGPWGYIDKSGTMVIEPEYTQAQSFSDGLALVQTATHLEWGYINKDGAVVITPQYREAKSFSEGLAAVQLEYR